MPDECGLREVLHGFKQHNKHGGGPVKQYTLKVSGASFHADCTRSSGSEEDRGAMHMWHARMLLELFESKSGANARQVISVSWVQLPLLLLCCQGPPCV